MTAFSQKYAIVQFFNPATEGYEYPSSNWPLHATIVDTFAIDWTVDEMVEHLAKLLANQPRAASLAGETAHFGDDGRVEVVLLERTDALVALHYAVLAALEPGKLILNDPQFAREGFLPHATVQAHARLSKGDRVAFTALSIVDMFPDGDPYKRKVLKTIALAA